MKNAGQTNLRAYSAYVFFTNLLFWTPVFFLVFSSYLDLSDVLLLEGIYYFAVVILEVPSGFASDRWGRKPVLVASAVMGILAYATFATAETFLGFCAAQVLFAFSISFNSGSDTSWHHDTIVAQGLEDEFMEREGKIVRLSLVAAALGGVCGGLIASVDLSLAYVASAVGASVALGSALVMKEPARERAPSTLVEQFKGIGTLVLNDRKLAWYGAAMMVLIVLNHLPYEFFQPYLAESVKIEWAPTSVWTGFHTTIALLIAAFASGRAASLAKRFGVPVVVLGAQACTTAILALMAFAFNPIIAGVLVLRSVPRGLATSPLNAAMAQRIGSHQKATFLSLVSLGGRLMFGLILMGLSVLGSWSKFAALEYVLAVSALVSGVLVATLWLFRPRRDSAEVS